MLLRLPGVYAPAEDTRLLLDAVLAEPLPPNARVCDLGTGSGFLALGLAEAGAAEVVAVDIGRRAVMGARLNAALRGLPVRARRSDLLAGVDGLFDVIVANPPYVPALTAAPGKHSRARAWDAGRDGRSILNRICADAPAHLKPGGSLWIVHSGVCGADHTVDSLSASGLTAEIIEKAEIPFGPVMRARQAFLLAEGLIGPGDHMETLVVVRGRRT